MDAELRDRIERAAEEHALFNALKHDADADMGAIMGPLMGDHPEFREHGAEIPPIIQPVVAAVNDRPPEERRERLAELAPTLLAELDADDDPDPQPALPALPKAGAVEQVRMRCAPNPNGPWHIGNARMPAVIGTYKDQYDGWFCIRFDDTDPETKRPLLDAYDWILEDLAYLGFEADEVYLASERLETYYEYACQLIDLGGAYTCDLPGEEFSALKNAGEPSPNRSKEPAVVREEFDRMVDGEYTPGEMVLRVRTDIEHKNPALRDWVAFRIIDRPHPRPAAAAYRCWPLLDFQSGIDDHVLGITHIIRGIDLQDSAKRQQFLYEYFDWTYPEVLHWGHVNVDKYDIPMSTSAIVERINAGQVSGWDDPQVPTLRSLFRRGIRGTAIVEAMIELGVSTSSVDLAMSTIYANNRERIDATTDRLFFVADPVTRSLRGEHPAAGHPPWHPTEARGTRTVPVDEELLIEAADRPRPGERVWLKGLGCFREADATFVWVGDDIDVVREEDVPVIHWVPAASAIDVIVERPDGTDYGVAEPAIDQIEPDTMLQFERYGFVRVDETSSDGVVVYFAHD